ncbi:MAG: sigma 54-interacting transcriptional regulator [Candidatus Hydrogenedentes bacterium]|nr:sigma 54-interacting transcriptional regulator [Candidatus Hydrogenedentota bacterium]
MFQLTVKSGANKGMSWPISERPLVLGRSNVCDIPVPDPVVSRRHCELWQADQIIQIRDLGSSNATLVNGFPVHEAKLRVGDEISLGAVVFVVAQAASPSAPEKRPVPDDDTPVTLWLNDAYYISQKAREPEGDDLPRSVNDLRELFILGRKFGGASSVRQLLDVLVGHLREKLSPAAIWMAWYSAPEKCLALHPFEGAAPNQDAPTEAMLRAVETGSGLLSPRSIREPNGRRLEVTLIAPISTGAESVGALAVRCATPQRVYDESDLEYFIAVAHALAPHIRAAGIQEQLRRDYEYARQRAGIPSTLVGESESLRAVRELAAKAAQTHLNVLVLGETGTGKELVARMIHDLGPRAQRPFVVVNCAAIPSSLFESELFGYEKNAFTGATTAKVGLFEEAHCGSLFLDEIGDLAPDNQARILRALETGTFYRVGGTRETHVDVRIIAATNRLTGPPEKGSSFRSDLYHRLTGFEIRVSPLRDRTEDIEPLSAHFLEEARQQTGSSVSGISPAALERLKAWLWPGNVRELRACIHRAVALARVGQIEQSHIALFAPIDATGGEGGILTLADAEKHHISRVLRQLGGNVSATARALKISRATLYNKFEEYDIHV